MSDENSKAKYFIDQAISTLRQLVIIKSEEKEDIMYNVGRLKKLLADNSNDFGIDYCIDKGSEIEAIVKDYLKYDDPEKQD